VRLVIGLVLLIATGVNHFVLGTIASGEEEIISFAEGTAVVYSVLLLFQSAIEYAKESYLPPPPSKGSSSKAAAGRKIRDSFAAAAAATEVLEQQWNNNNNNDIGEQEEEEYRSKVQWAAASYLSMTPTSQIMLLDFNDDHQGNDGGGTIRYRLGGSETNKNNNDANGRAPTVGAGVQAALDELRQSKGGRIALPLTHPAVQALLPPQPSTTTDNSDDRRSDRLRTVILQRITDNSCWLAASDQLLAGYTPGDLKWLGEMAEYVRV